MQDKQEKTNVMRILDQKKISYTPHFYDNTEAISGTEVAAVLGQNPDQVFKTLVTVSSSKRNYVFVVFCRTGQNPGYIPPGQRFAPV